MGVKSLKEENIMALKRRESKSLMKNNSKN
jgi:hypothetical protein